MSTYFKIKHEEYENIRSCNETTVIVHVDFWGLEM